MTQTTSQSWTPKECGYIDQWAADKIINRIGESHREIMDEVRASRTKLSDLEVSLSAHVAACEAQQRELVRQSMKIDKLHERQDDFEDEIDGIRSEIQGLEAFKAKVLAVAAVITGAMNLAWIGIQAWLKLSERGHS